MTTAFALQRLQTRADGILRWAVLALLAFVQPSAAQERPVHWLHAGVMPPGAIGSQRLERGGPVSGYFQPVRIRAPQGARIALGEEGTPDGDPQNDILVGMLIGPVYRIQLTEIPNSPGIEVYPTIEIIDRLYPPPGLATRYPIPIELTLNELELASRGAFVTRVIYVEDPQSALPVAQTGDEQPWIEAAPGRDPLVEADERGRPVAILRIGARLTPGTNVPPGGAAPYVLLDAENVCPTNEPHRNEEMLEVRSTPDSTIDDETHATVIDGPLLGTRHNTPSTATRTQPPMFVR